jgi:nucleoside-diphosphate-sugar epimerase
MAHLMTAVVSPSPVSSRVAVTGAGGFLGGHIARALAAGGAEVLPLGRGDVEAILRDPAPLAGCSALVHAAAVRHRHGVPTAEYRDSNVQLVARVLRACAGRVRRFVYVSSVGVYGFPSALPITERSPYAPVTLYSATKVEAERVARTVAGEVGVELTILRPTITYGKGDTNGMLDKMARMIRAGSYRIVGDGTNVLHHTHVDDIVQGVLLACQVPAAGGEDFILCGPETITLARLSELVARTVGARLPRLHVPLGLARAAATVVDVAAYRGWAFAAHEPPISHEKLDVMTRAIAFSAAKAAALLGYAPRVGYEEGVARTLQ